MKDLTHLMLATSLLVSSGVSLSYDDHTILLDGKIAPGEEFGLGVDDSEHRRDWLFETAGSIELKYPGHLGWGAIFITVGEPVDPPRPSSDFSAYNTLIVRMKGETGGECIKVGIKDYNDPDNGKEPKTPVKLESSWSTYSFDIRDHFDVPRAKKRYSPLELNKLYVLAEFVFPCRGKNNAQTVHIKDVKFVR